MFKLVEASFYEHPVLFNKTYRFVGPGETRNSPYFSIIIGPNGSGKSILLRCISEVFLDLLFRTKRKMSFLFGSGDYNYFIKYYIEKDLFEVHKTGPNLEIKKNGEVSSIDNLNVPTSIIACSTGVNDKFPFIPEFSSRFIPNYKYLGLRASSNAFYLASINKSFFKSFSTLVSQGKKQTQLKALFKYLKLDQFVQFEFRSSLKYYDHPNLLLSAAPLEIIVREDSRVFEHGLTEILKISKGTYRRLDLKDQDLIDQKLDDYLKQYSQNEEFANFVAREIKWTNNRLRKVYSFSIDFSSPKGFIEGRKKLEFLNVLFDLGIIGVGKVSVSKNHQEAFNVTETSSGEYFMLNNFLRLLASIEESSVILIDEPETSLHPNWQIQYIDLCRKIFKDFKGCQYIISTHSHFIIPQLDKKHSNLITLIYNSKEEEYVPSAFNVDASGWSIENILYEVFGLATTRNHYFEADVRKLISLVTYNKDAENLDEIQKLVNKLRAFLIDERDPLKAVIDEAEEFLESKQ